MILKGPFKYGYRAYPRQAMYFTMAEGYVNGILTIMSVSRDKPKESRWAAKSLWCTISLPPISSPHNLTITA